MKYLPVLAGQLRRIFGYSSIVESFPARRDRIATIPAALNRSHPSLRHTWPPHSRTYFMHSPNRAAHNVTTSNLALSIRQFDWTPVATGWLVPILLLT